jgi:hypothetical protein
MKQRLKELEDRVKMLEEYVLRDVQGGTELETVIHWQENYEELEDGAEADRDTATSEDGRDLSA